MGDMGTTAGQADMQMYGSTAPPSAAQVVAAALQETDASLQKQHDPLIGGGFTRWHSHLVTCVNGHRTIAGFDVQLRDGCNPATWRDKYTAQMLHVWVVPYPGGVFSDDLSAAATSSAVHDVLADHGSRLFGSVRSG